MATPTQVETTHIESYMMMVLFILIVYKRSLTLVRTQDPGCGGSLGPGRTGWRERDRSEEERELETGEMERDSARDRRDGERDRRQERES